MFGARTAFKAASSAGVLPAFGWTLLVVALLALVTGLWAGNEWQRGRTAIADSARLQAQAKADRAAIDELLATGRKLAQLDVDRTAAYDQAAQRMDALATTLETTLERNRTFAAQQRDALADLLARRPDLRALDLGADVLSHWNGSNAGAAPKPATDAAARPAGQPAPAVPAAPGRAQQPGARPAGEPRRGGGAVPGLSRSGRIAPAGGRRVAGNGMGLVLQRGGSGRPRCVGVPCA